jgi:hypothetical protein
MKAVRVGWFCRIGDFLIFKQIQERKKKMKKLVMVLVVLALCVPTYGYILVYKVTMSGTVAGWKTTPDGWLLSKASGRGYLVLDVDDDDPNVLNDVQFIDYYTEDHDKLYDMWDAGEEFTHSILPGRPPKGKNIVCVDLNLVDSGFELGGRVLGTVKSTDIGTLDEDEKKEKVDVATSLKGVGAWESYEDDTLNESGYGTLSLTLDSKWTKTANNPDEEKGFGGNFENFLAPESDAPQGLINWLESKGYGPAGG